MAFVSEHLGKGVQSPLIIHHPIEIFFALSMLFHDHLSLTQITNHRSSLNQCVRDEMRVYKVSDLCYTVDSILIYALLSVLFMKNSRHETGRIAPVDILREE